MNAWLSRNGLSYFYSGSLTLIATWVVTAVMGLTLTGCRFGNRVQEAPSADTTSGYYSTAPQSLRVFASTTSGEFSANASVGKIPSFPSAILTNPVRFVLASSGSSQAYVAHATNDKLAFPVQMTSMDTKQFGISNEDAYYLWRDNDSCYFVEYIDVVGSLQPLGDSASQVAFGGNTFSVKGRFSSKVQIVQKIAGTDCSTSLQMMLDCYQNVSSCDGATANDRESRQELARSMLDLHLQSGVITPQDVPNLTALAFEANYQ